ncbi:hypothetical protein ACFSJW_08300 [Flavobacterium artemisiae]|uniref:Uncharacterized protein n=1 Tax=Flavobacterium artemisiae TaxID=2126556 RepID=A0ABW4HFN1_9FLAO
MAIQTLETIKNWFRTSLKPTQQQFWDTWDSFRHKEDKIYAKEIEYLSEFIKETTPKLPVEGNLNRVTKIGNDLEGNIVLKDSNIEDLENQVIINSATEIDSQIEGESGLKFRQLKNKKKAKSEIIFPADVMPTVAIDGTAYFAYGNVVKKVNPDNTITDYFSLPEGCLISSKIITSSKNLDLFLLYEDDDSFYHLIKFNQTGVLSVLRSSNIYCYNEATDKNDNIYINEPSTTTTIKVDTSTSSNSLYYDGDITMSILGFDLESNCYFYHYDNYNIIYKLDPNGNKSVFINLGFELGGGCVKPDGSLYITSNNYEDKNIYFIDKLGTTITVYVSMPYRPHALCLLENGFLYVHNNDYDNGLVYKISPDGAFSMVGNAGNSPRYMAVTQSGVVYVSNSASYNIIKISEQSGDALLTLDDEGKIILTNKEIIAQSDFKTINGESLIGSGDITTNNASSLEEVLDHGNTTSKSAVFYSPSYSDRINISWEGLEATDSPQNSSVKISKENIQGFNIEGGLDGVNTLNLTNRYVDGDAIYNFDQFKPAGHYTIATRDDIKNGLPVSATESGIINNEPLQELGGSDKLINGIRIGKGNANFENNLVIGRNGLASVTTGQYNVAIGNGDGEVEGPLQYLTTGINNTMVGSDAGVNTISGNNNTGIGTLSLFENTTGSNNTAIGFATLASNTEGNSNTAVGVSALNSNTTGTYNDAFGRLSLSKNTTGSYNTALGNRSLYENISGLYNTAIGTGALYRNQFGSQNVAIGFNALRDNVGTDGSNIYGHRSIAIGGGTMQLNTTGHGIAIGNFAMSQQTTGTHNISIGLQAGSGITTGNGNVIVAGTGFIQAGGGITTGNNNMIISPNNGNTTGITTGNGNVILGKVAGLNAALENNIVISNGVGNIKAQNDGTNWKFTGQLNKTALDVAPDSATATGTVGEIRYTADYIYVCTATNKWVRSALTTW